MTNKQVSIKKIEILNQLTNSNWNNPVYYSHFKDDYTAFQKADFTKNESCSSKIEYCSFGTPKICPYYFSQVGFCSLHNKFILEPEQTTCIYHPLKALTRLYKAEKNIRDMQEHFSNEEDKALNALSYISDLKNDMGSFLEIIPASDEINDEKGRYLDMALNFFSELFSFSKSEK